MVKTKLNKSVNQQLPFISIIIPFRNEKDNLPQLLKALKNQSYSSESFEIIAVDDHSTDNTSTLIKENPFFHNVKIIDNSGEGKKSALQTGILTAIGELIATIDADCIPNRKWLETVANSYLLDNWAMLQGPVKMSGANSFLSHFQSIEYLALQMCCAGAIFLKQPLFCSGANLTFNKNEWRDVINEISGKYNLSGDDVFLLHAFKKKKKKIAFLKCIDACVTTNTEKNITNFIKQRMRWGGKSTEYNDLQTITVALLIFLFNFFLLIALILLLLNYKIYFTVMFAIKMVMDYLILKKGTQFFDIKMPLHEFFLFSIIYPFYLIFAAMGSMFMNVSWKGRKTKL
jgi:glycosyltransferase involved in cell wall biosynthesis